MLNADIFQYSKPPHLKFSYRRTRLHCRALLPYRRFLPLRPLRHPCILRSTTATYSWVRKSSLSRKDCHGTTLEIVVDEFVETGVSDLPVELSLTRSLGPALTLGHAVNAMKDAIKKLKLNPPCSRSGVLRFQVLVPPSIKSLNWLYSQNKLLAIFPQFYILSRQDLEQSHVPTRMTEIHGVSGLGSAIVFRGSSAVLRGYHLMKRYLSFESPLVRTYGFTTFNENMKSNFMCNQYGSYYFFIPQIELNEFENFSLLASNLVWDNSLFYSLDKAFHWLERSLHQISTHVSSLGTCNEGTWNCFEGQSKLNEVDFNMVYMNAETLSKMLDKGRLSPLEEPAICETFFFRHSTTVLCSKNTFSLRGTINMKECANINLLWASLIVEECVRLGLTYFCIAPGSRSSPLALSAISHSLTSCISCYDERSLAYHALGYGRGSHKPAVVITSSGTAVSNLFPAVVEASQDFVPLLLLTADRPPELLDTGANQAIDQVNHFGKFVKFFFSLPPSTDEMPARMVLTTIDSAVYSASQSPCGPVHVNCPFREPLEDSPKAWDLKCLEGLNLWMLKEEPYTKYIKVQHACSYSHDNMSNVLDIIKGANQGLLVVGAIQAEDEIWAALQLVKHLSWPTVPDILSGLRLRRQLTSQNAIEHDILFLDHLDHALLSGSVKSWLKPDVVVQIGSRVTSKRVSQFLEFCSPISYIFVDKHPYRHDPSHLITHRLQCSIVEFADIILAKEFPERVRTWNSILREINAMVAMEISFQIYSESFLTEPYVAHVIGDVLKGDTALFIGNSMAIRDLDMYGKGWIKPFPISVPVASNCNMQFNCVQTSGNRGASGIDGLLSTSIGFAVGSNKRVVCVIGDVSFLHDTNGLAILSNRTRRRPITIVVINNHGGAIFSLLPIALETKPSVLNQYFYTKHDISIEKLCMAHGVKHLMVQTKMELHHALWEAHQGQNDCVVEVESCIPDNAKFHRIQLCSPTTSTHIKHDRGDFFHEGFVLAITLDDKVIGYGEIAPIAIHKEDLLDVEEQLRFLVHAMEGAELSCVLPLLKGSFTHWIQKSLGILPSSIFPSVRCGIEMAILNALATRQGSSISDLSGYQSSLVGNQIITHGESTCRLTGMPICALVDCRGTPKEVAHVVSQLFHGGFTTVKMKVARREDPTEDAAVISEIRQCLGYQISIRADANRKWTYDKAVQFATSVKHFALEYIEEPVCFEDDIITFCEETGLLVALDETINNITWENLHKLEKFVHPGIVAVVIKPSVVGGFENALLIAKWAQKHEKMAIVSSTFESSLGLSAYIQFAQIIEDSNKAISEMKKIKYRRTVAHGLGTFQWLKQDISIESLKISIPPKGSRVEAFVVDADIYLRNFQLNHEVVVRNYGGEQFRSYNLEVNTKYISYTFKLLESVCAADGKVVIFLHGFLGSSQDWIPLMKALSATTQCIAVDLPGHGESRVRYHTEVSKQEPYLSFESVAEALLKLICDTTTSRVILVGYSMGGRIALHLSLKYSETVDGAVIISGSPGLRDETTQRICISQDSSRALYLLSHGLSTFLDTWYEGSLWKSLRAHPLFNEIISRHGKHQDTKGLAKALTDLSIGRQRPLWNELKQCKKPLLLLVGEKDMEFRGIAEEMCREVESSPNGEVDGKGNLCQVLVVPECGHAVHLENPLPVINAVRKFLTRVSCRR